MKMSTSNRRSINNPFTSIEQYNCFGCSPSNEFGLQMEFYDEGDETVCEWEPKPHFQGYGNILHGGIISTMMDEIASWYVFTKLKTAGVIDLPQSTTVHVRNIMCLEEMADSMDCGI